MVWTFTSALSQSCNSHLSTAHLTHIMLILCNVLQSNVLWHSLAVQGPDKGAPRTILEELLGTVVQRLSLLLYSVSPATRLISDLIFLPSNKTKL